MISRSNSAPRMKQVYTSRVKDGRRSNDAPEVHYYGKSGGKFTQANPQYHYNPENSPAKRKLYPKEVQHDVEQFVEQKLNIQPAKNDQLKAHKNAPQEKAVPKNQQKTIQGRKLQYPAEQKYGAYHNRPQSVQLQRSSSVSSTSGAFKDTTMKSSAIKEKKKDFDDKFKIAFNYLLESNESYLRQVHRACRQKARPKDQIFKIKRPTLRSTNQNEYQQKDTPYEQHMAPFAESVANSFGPRKVCGNSTTNEFHNGKHGPKADLANWPDHYKLQGPLDGTTTYANKFPNHGKFDKMVPVVEFNEHPRGCPHTANSTHRTFFKGDQTKKADLVKWNNLHPYGNDFDPNRGTTYGCLHNSKDKNPIQNWPMHEPRPIVTDGKFETEYQAKLKNPTDHELNDDNYCRCGRKWNAH